MTCSLYTEIVFARPNQTTCTVYIHAGTFIVQDLISISKEYNVYIYISCQTQLYFTFLVLDHESTTLYIFIEVYVKI